MRQWIKLYTEIVHDRKMASLTDRQFRVCVNLFALAGTVDDGGIVPPIEDIAFQLRMDEADLLDDMRALLTLGIMQEYKGVWMVSHWSNRQAKAPSSSREAILERVHRYRAKQRNEDVTPLQNVTKNVTLVTTREREEREEREDEKVVVVDQSYALALRAYENDISLLSGTLTDDMRDMWDLLTANNTPDWWYKAIEVAVGANKRSWRYVRGILQKCLTEGHPPNTGTPKSSSGNGHKAAEPLTSWVSPDGKERIIGYANGQEVRREPLEF